MSVTILTAETRAASDRARVEGDDLWLPVDELEAATGWHLEPEGLCRDEVCVPIYGDVGGGLVEERDGAEWVNFAGFARYFGLPVARDAEHGSWYFGKSAAAQRSALEWLEAPDFELTDLEGQRHRRSDHRGKKQFLAVWASW